MRVLLIALLLAACGDNTTPSEPLFVGVSGSRIKLQWYLYQDGSRELETAAFYDARLHTRCSAEPWNDGISRCTPLGETTVFEDGACTMEVGRTTDARTPQYFRREEQVAGARRIARVVRAGRMRAERPAAFFALRDGACTAIAEPETIYYWDVGVDVTDLAEVWPETVGDARLGLVTLASVEGLSAPLGFHDQALGIPCRPATLPDGAAACVPTSAPRADAFADPYCEVPLVVADEPPPAIQQDGIDGCATYHAAGEAVVGSVYRRVGAACLLAGPRITAYRVGPALALAPITRVREPARGTRLQRITVTADGQRTIDPRLYDTATRGECHSFGNGELAMCIPASALAGSRAYANPTCTREVLVADVPQRQCERSTFAIVDEMSVHQIGNATSDPLFTYDDTFGCRARPPAVNALTHALGPPVPPETFVAGVVFSER